MLIEWISGAGGYVHPATQCHLAHLPDGSLLRGISTNQAVPPDTLLLQVPQNCTTPEPLHPYFFNFIGDQDGRVTTTEEDVTNKVWQRNIENYRIKQRLGQLDPLLWGPYLRSLPSLEEHRERHLLFAPDALFDEFAFLPASAILRHIRDELYAKQGECAGAGATVAACDDLLYSTVTFMSRAFGKHGLVPFVDLINSADVGKTNINLIHESHGWRITAAIKPTGLQTGEEWVHEYGRGVPFIQNEHYALQFGFLLPSQTYPSLADAPRKACRAWLLREMKRKAAGAHETTSTRNSDGPQRRLFVQMARAACS